jgi:hypothetical protein
MQNARTLVVARLALSTIGLPAHAAHSRVPLGPRLFSLVDQPEAGALRDKLAACVAAIERAQPHDFSRGHGCGAVYATTNCLVADLTCTGRVPLIPAPLDHHGPRVKSAPARGCTPALTCAEFKHLPGKTDTSNLNAPTVEAFLRQASRDAFTNDGGLLRTLNVLAQDVGLIGLCPDWPATTTFDVNCLN